MIYITEVRMSNGGSDHEHIEAVRWERRDCPEAGESTREEMVHWLGIKKRGFAYVRDRKGHDVPVHAIRPKGRRPYIRTKADKKKWRDDLLDLPRYGVPPGAIKKRR